MDIEMTLGPKERPTPEDMAEIEAASRRPVDYSDIPPSTEAELRQIAATVRSRRANRKKEVVSIRLSPDTIAYAKSLFGQGYTGVFGRVISSALNNPALLKECLEASPR